MDKELAIEQINLAKQRVNEGSKAFRDQIDFNVLPLVKEDAVVTGLVKEARAAWTSADRLAKNWLEQAKARILQPIPPEPIYPKTCPLAGMQSAGWFNSFKIFGDAINPRKYLYELAMTGIEEQDCFAFLSDNEAHHRNLTYETPFFWDGDRFHLHKQNPKFFDDLRNAYVYHKEAERHLCIQLWMKKNYINYPYSRNVNGVSDFWDDEAMQYHERYAIWVCETAQDVYGGDYNVRLKISPNEVTHRNVAAGKQGEKYHQIMYFCERIWEAVRPYTTLPSCVVCQGGCEGTAAELMENHNCSKPASCDRNGRHGKKEYARSKWASVKGQKHKFSTWTDYEIANVYRGLLVTPYKDFTEDGGGRAKDGKYVVRGKFFLADGDQAEYLGKKLAIMQQERNGHMPIHRFFTHEVIQIEPDGLFVPIATYERVKPTFERAKRFAKGYREVVG